MWGGVPGLQRPALGTTIKRQPYSGPPSGPSALQHSDLGRTPGVVVVLGIGEGLVLAVVELM